MFTRNVQSEDYEIVVDKMNEWWGGEEMHSVLPRFFFYQFRDSSYVIQDNHEVIGFLIGFPSRSTPTYAYLYLIGIDPRYRRQGLASSLYKRFFQAVYEKGCKEVHCTTLASNEGSIQYHEKLGFTRIDETEENASGLMKEGSIMMRKELRGEKEDDCKADYG
ncbi:hypothetical protein N781_07050 [Pontibacillus halophilus JSM 076056 = DSM 19796]|uniref:N-acetyltransferase domain-containing protein n=1 Tax=Pontibacillus halophilus JSM 076056 = DSM 19796 TaxID=1385510 RepID=A0A0A5GEZ8_9BACI|nr:GNAT family N-acetyltransferase [Pontibacillus halophilus]KGX90544.1 hypothetical protein N781_07050 [Pontibacillus halophilus JSM 076056 = DSM 19796]